MSEKKELSPEIKERLKKEFSQDWRKDLRKSIPVKERMKISRRKMPERKPQVRNKDFDEVNLGLDEKAAIEEGLKLLVQVNSQRKLRALKGKISWEGDLEEMRAD